jgi:hypothetical protein
MILLAHLARLLLAALAFGLSAPSMGQEAEPAPPSPRVVSSTEVVTIPFAPPLDTPLAYRLRFERKRSGGDTVVEVDQRLTFTRHEGGYVLTLEQLAIAMGGRRLDLADKRVLDAVPLSLRVYLLPMSVELDAMGGIVRLRDWPEMQDSLRAMPEAMAKVSGQPLNDASLATMRSLLEPIINGSAEDAPGVLIRGWPAVLGYGGLESMSGAPITADTATVTPFSPEPIPARLEGSVTRTPDGKIYLVQSTVIDPAAMRTLMLAVMERIEAQAPAAGGSNPADEIRSLDITDTVGINFDPVTGLPVTARVARLTSVTNPTGTLKSGEITTLTRIAP